MPTRTMVGVPTMALAALSIGMSLPSGPCRFLNVTAPALSNANYVRASTTQIESIFAIFVAPPNLKDVGARHRRVGDKLCRIDEAETDPAACAIERETLLDTNVAQTAKQDHLQ